MAVNISEYFEGAYGTMYMVRDMKKTVQYYKDLLNLEPTFESEEWTEFNFGTHALCLHSTEENARIDGKGVLITKVRELDAVVSELKKRGVEFSKEISDVCEGGRAADYRDPSGNVVSLFEYRPAH